MSLRPVLIGALLLISMHPTPVRALSWIDQYPESPAVDIFYDFRPTLFGQPNRITTEQAQVAVAALHLWSHHGNVNFVHNPWASEYAILNIGAIHIDGPWNIIGQGGYRYTNIDGVPHIRSGVVAMDVNEAWDLSIGGAAPPGTLNFFTVAAHEIGHALGLDHSLHPDDIMYESYTGPKAVASATDIAAIQSRYGASAFVGVPPSEPFHTLTAVPEPSTLSALLLGLVLLAATRWAACRPLCTVQDRRRGKAL